MLLYTLMNEGITMHVAMVFCADIVVVLQVRLCVRSTTVLYIQIRYVRPIQEWSMTETFIVSSE